MGQECMGHEEVHPFRRCRWSEMQAPSQNQRLKGCLQYLMQGGGGSGRAARRVSRGLVDGSAESYRKPSSPSLSSATKLCTGTTLSSRAIGRRHSAPLPLPRRSPAAPPPLPRRFTARFRFHPHSPSTTWGALEGGNGQKRHPIKFVAYGRGLVLPRYLKEPRRGE